MADPQEVLDVSLICDLAGDAISAVMGRRFEFDHDTLTRALSREMFDAARMVGLEVADNAPVKS